MPFREMLGRTLRWQLSSVDARFARLAPPRDPTLALSLPRAELPDGAQLGDLLDVFVYLDSEDSPVATTRPPRLQLGEVAFLEVTDITTFGAFVDWGLPKDLLVPFKEQTRELARGDREPIGLKLDKTGRLAGTMRVSELLRSRADFKRNAWVAGEAWRNDPELGLFVILERGHVGLLPAYEPHTLARGQAASFRIAQSLPDGKLELSLRGLAHEEIEDDARRVLERLRTAKAERVSERADPELIRRRFSMSKKAFKRAVGRLLRDGAVVVDADGFITPVTPR
jgi:uncharacterized protein